MIISGIIAALATAPLFDRVLTKHLGFTSKIVVPILSVAWLSLIWDGVCVSSAILFNHVTQLKPGIPVAQLVLDSSTQCDQIIMQDYMLYLYSSALVRSHYYRLLSRLVWKLRARPSRLLPSSGVALIS